MEKPSERILELTRALQIIDGKTPTDKLSMYETVAIAQYLDEMAREKKEVIP